MKETLHIYTRVSTRVQESGTSLSTQEQLGKDKAKQLGMKAQIWNEGSASSNHEDLVNRPKLLELMNEVEKGNVSHLFVFNNDRLSRNDVTQQTIKLALQKNDVVLYTKDGQFDLTNPQDKLFKTVLDGIASYDNALRAERSRLGKLAKVKEGYWYGAPPPYGYKTENKKLAIDKEESKWVKKIFNWVYDGKSLIWIKSQLDKNGVVARRGKFFSTGSLNVLLKNTHFIGYYYWSDKKSGEVIRCECPPIIDETVREEVTKRREISNARQNQKNRTEKFYLLRDFMVCGECGTNMRGRIDINAKGEKTQQTYYCPKKEKDWRDGVIERGNKWKRGKVGERGCGMNRSLNIPITDKMVSNLVMDVISHSTMLKEEFKDEVLKAKFASDEENQTLRKKEEKNQNRLSRKIEETRTTLADVETKRLLDEFDDYIVFSKVQKNLKKEIEKTQRELEQSRMRARELGNQKKWLDWLSTYGEEVKLQTVLSPTKKKEYLEGVLEKIEVSLDKQTLNHDLRVFFRMGLVDDKIEYKNPKKKSAGYAVIEGKKDKLLVIARADVLQLQQEARRQGRQKQVKKKGL